MNLVGKKWESIAAYETVQAHLPDSFFEQLADFSLRVCLDVEILARK
jgi:hypothetical protein